MSNSQNGSGDSPFKGVSQPDRSQRYDVPVGDRYEDHRGVALQAQGFPRAAAAVAVLPRDQQTQSPATSMMDLPNSHAIPLDSNFLKANYVAYLAAKEDVPFGSYTDFGNGGAAVQYRARGAVQMAHLFTSPNDKGEALRGQYSAEMYSTALNQMTDAERGFVVQDDFDRHLGKHYSNISRDDPHAMANAYAQYKVDETSRVAQGLVREMRSDYPEAYSNLVSDIESRTAVTTRAELATARGAAMAFHNAAASGTRREAFAYGQYRTEFADLADPSTYEGDPKFSEIAGERLLTIEHPAYDYDPEYSPSDRTIPHHVIAHDDPLAREFNRTIRGRASERQTTLTKMTDTVIGAARAQNREVDSDAIEAGRERVLQSLFPEAGGGGASGIGGGGGGGSIGGGGGNGLVIYDGDGDGDPSQPRLDLSVIQNQLALLGSAFGDATNEVVSFSQAAETTALSLSKGTALVPTSGGTAQTGMVLSKGTDLVANAYEIERLDNEAREQGNQIVRRDTRGDLYRAALGGALGRQSVAGDTAGMRRAGATGSLLGSLFKKTVGVSLAVGSAQTLSGAINALPFGAQLSAPLDLLQSIGANAAPFELPALQAGMTRGIGFNSGSPISRSSAYPQIQKLSTELGLAPAQAAGLLRDVGFGSGGQMSTNMIKSLVTRGFDASAISQLGGQLGSANAGNLSDILTLMGTGVGRGLSNSQVMAFTSGATDLAAARGASGLMGNASMTGRRAVGMMQAGGTSLTNNLQTIGRFQQVGMGASKGITSFAEGMMDTALQAYAMNQAGGDPVKAQRILEDLSADPSGMRDAIMSLGVDDAQADIMMLGSQSLTTRDVERSRFGAAKKGEILKGTGDTSQSLFASRTLANKSQKDLSDFYTSNKGAFTEFMRQQTSYQRAMLKKVPDAATVAKIGNKLVKATENLKYLQALTKALANTADPIGSAFRSWDVPSTKEYLKNMERRATQESKSAGGK